MTLTITKCPTRDCDSTIVICDNSVYLDHPAIEYNEHTAGWTIMQLGDYHLASVGNPGFDNKGHSLHQHQPIET